MKILFVTGHKYFPQTYGGVQTSTDQLCRGLIDRGHKVALLTGFMHDSGFAHRAQVKMKVNRLLHGCAVARDAGFGYPVWRSWFPWEAMGFVADKEQPDVVVVMSGLIARMGLAAKRLGLPLLLHLHDVAFDEHDGPFEELADIASVANSQFTARKYREAYGIAPSVIYPFIDQARYRTGSSRQAVTFINPHRSKGLKIALEIASHCPDIAFRFVEGWALSSSARGGLMSQLSTLPNVTMTPSCEDMRAVYGQCKILIAPSLCEEAFGRVASEAQLSGIPVVASNRGGLPEAVGPGGILIDPDGPIDVWVAAVKELWRNEPHYAQLSAAALAHAERDDVNFSRQLDAHEHALLAVLGGSDPSIVLSGTLIDHLQDTLDCGAPPPGI